VIDSVKTILEKLDYKIDAEDTRLIEFFNENGYCIVPKSDLVANNLEEYRRVVDSLLQKESWRGGWEGKEERMKYKGDYQPGANRLGNLFNKHELFIKLITEKNILKIAYGIFGDDMQIDALDMREPRKNKGGQAFHLDWVARKENDKIQNMLVFPVLDDANKSNGVIRFVPKSHKKTGFVEDHIADKLSHPEETSFELKKACIVFMHGNLWHSGTTNTTGNRRRFLYLDIRRRNIPQLLNQRIYLDENTQKKLTDLEKFLLCVGDNHPVFEPRSYEPPYVANKTLMERRISKLFKKIKK